MSGVEDLNLKVKADSAPAVSSIDQIGKAVDRATTAISRIASALNFAVGEIRIFNSSMQEAAKAGDVAQQSVDLLALRIDPMGNSAAKFAHQIESVGDQWKRAVTPGDSAAKLKAIQAMTAETTRLRNEMIFVGSAASSVRIPNSPQRASGGTGGGSGVNFVRVAAVAGQLAVMSRVNVTMQGVNRSMAQVSQSTTATTSALTRFKIGLSAPKVNEKLNVAPTLFQRIGAAASGAVDLLRGFADASIAGIGATLISIATAATKFLAAMDAAGATASKWLSKAKSMRSGLTLLQTVFQPFAAQFKWLADIIDKLMPIATRFVEWLDRATARAGNTRNKLSELAYVMTGVHVTGKALGDTVMTAGAAADSLARASFYAALPMRLLKREAEGGYRIFNAMKHVLATVTAPLDRLVLSVKKGSTEWAAMNKELPTVKNRLVDITGASTHFATAVREMGNLSKWAREKAAQMLDTYDKGGKRADSGIGRLVAKLREFQNLKLDKSKELSAVLSMGKAQAGPAFQAWAKQIEKEVQRVRVNLKIAQRAVSDYVGKFEIGARLHRAFSQTAFIVGTSGKVVYGALTNTSKAAVIGGKALHMMAGFAVGSAKALGLISASRAALQLTGIGVAARTASSGLATVARTPAAGLRKIGSESKIAIAGLAGLAIATVGWGASTAIASEKSGAIFGTMLHDMAQGKELVSRLSGSQAASLFDNQELLDSGRLIFKAGVAADGVTGKTNQLAKIAVATSSELGDLARIYQQGAKNGSYGMDKINQLTERGVAIMDGLTAATGKSGGELNTMISNGEIGIKEMDAALAHLTEGQGYYANALTDVGNTTSGMMSQVKNNVQQALGALMSGGVEAFRPLLSSLVSFTAGLKTTLVAVAPLVVATVQMIMSPLTALKDVGIFVMQSIWGEGAGAFTSLIAIGMKFVTAGTWYFTNYLNIAKFMWTSFALIGVQAFMTVGHFLTKVLPAYLTWFADNWVNVFRDAGNFIMTALNNIGKNIGELFVGIWNWIASGFSEPFDAAFVGITDGFTATVSALPKIAERELGPLEKSLMESQQQLGTGLADSFDKMMADANATLKVEPPAPVDLSTTGTTPDGEATDGGKGGGGGKGRTSFAVDSLNRDSAESLKAIFSASATNKTPEKALDQHKQANKYLKTIASNKPRVAGGA